MSATVGRIEQALAPLDAARRGLLATLLKVRWLGPQLARRDSRLALLISVESLGAFTCALLLPSAMLVLVPLLLGIPHVAADFRHLVLRRGLGRDVLLAVLLGVVALATLRIVDVAGLWRPSLRLEALVATLWCLGLAVLGARRTQAPWRAVVVTGVTLGLGLLTVVSPMASRLGFAHLHNVLAIVLWLVLFRRRLRPLLAPLAFIALLAVALGSGALLDVTLQHGQLEAFGLHLLLASDYLAPDLAPRLALGLTCSYVFLQSLHYGAWLLIIPQEDRRGEGTATFTQTWRALRRELGRWGLGLLCGGTLLVLGLGALAPLRTRDTYLSLALFHGYLELAMLAYFLARGGPRLVRQPA